MVSAMVRNEGSRKCTIRLLGLQPGAREEDLIGALQRLFRIKTPEQVRNLLKHLPAVLTDKATEETALKVSSFLNKKGAVLSIANSEISETVSDGTAPQDPIQSTESQVEESPEEASPPAGIERRAKPRIHPGIQIHAMGIGGILGHSFRLLWAHFWLLFFIVFIPQAALFVLSSGLPLLIGFLTGWSPRGVSIGFRISGGISFVTFVVVQFWAQGALIHAVSETYLGHRTSVGNSYGSTLRKLFRLLGTLVLLTILVFVWPAIAVTLGRMAAPELAGTVGGPLSGVIAVIVGIPVLWLTVRLFLNWLLADKVVVLEDKTWMSALRRSRELMRSRMEAGFWRRPRHKASLIIAIGFLIALTVNLLFQLSGIGLLFVLPGLFSSALSGLLNVIASSLATVYTSTALIIFYYDTRRRKEGFDLRSMAKGLG